MKKFGVIAFLLLLGIGVVVAKQYREKSELMQIISSSFETLTQTETTFPVQLDKCVDENDFVEDETNSSNNFVYVCVTGTTANLVYPCVMKRGKKDWWFPKQYKCGVVD